MIAVIETGSKQYLVQENTVIRVEKLLGEAGSPITFDQVLLVSQDDGKGMKLGTPTISGAKVTGTIAKQARNKKIMVVKYQSKTRHMTRHGHRQHYTEIKIDKIAV